MAAAALAKTGGDRARRGLAGGQGPVGRDVFARGQPNGAGVVRAGRTGDVMALLRACLVALRLSAEAGAFYRVPGPPFWTVADAAERIRAMLDLAGEEGRTFKAFLPKVATNAPERELRCRVAVAEIFLARLELTRDGNIIIEQPADWTTIELKPLQVSQ